MNKLPKPRIPRCPDLTASIGIGMLALEPLPNHFVKKYKCLFTPKIMFFIHFPTPDDRQRPQHDPKCSPNDQRMVPEGPQNSPEKIRKKYKTNTEKVWKNPEHVRKMSQHCTLNCWKVFSQWSQNNPRTTAE